MLEGAIALVLVLLVALAMGSAPATAAIRGRLANPGLVDTRIKATYFFPGEAFDGTAPYGCSPGTFVPGSPDNNYMLTPTSDVQLHWSQSAGNRTLVLDSMVTVGINTVIMSVWGEDFLTCEWDSYTAPMQDSPKAQDELFAAALGKPLTIIPELEERGDKSKFPWSFANEFPTRADGAIAPGTISQIENLITRYLKPPANPKYKDVWARMYDQQGNARYLVGIIHASSNRLGASPDAPFAAGFDSIAAHVLADTDIPIGFLIDPLPPGTKAPGLFCPSASGTGPRLATTVSVLGIMPFAPEVFLGSSDTPTVTTWKRSFSQGWFQSGVPFVMDVSSGYDGQIVFHNSVRYGLTASWLSDLAIMVHQYGDGGMVFNSWNGYTESMVAVPTVELKDMVYEWLRSLQTPDVYAAYPPAPTPRHGTWDSPYTWSEAMGAVPVGGTIGLKPTYFSSFDNPPILTKPCIIRAVGGDAKVGK